MRARSTPQGLDHYKCYAAPYTLDATGKPILRFTLPPSVGLKDQFRDGSVNVRAPFMLCAPVHKQVSPNGTPSTLVNPGVHLVCFSMVDSSTTPLPTQVFARNQFGVGVLAPANPLALCVPSKKQIVTSG